MDRNRKILASILALLILSIIMAVTDITFRIQDTEKRGIKAGMPQIGPGVGIIRIEGPINMSSGAGLVGVKSQVERIIDRLDSLSRNSDIKALVVRINSPGGTVAATQEIYQKIWKLRKKNIPIVASMGDIAASGGYYAASACNYIIANHGTITGSIGVIAFSPNLKGLFEKLGIKMNVIKSGNYKDILSSHRDLTKEEFAMLQKMIDSSYRKFLKDIALGRNMNQSEIEPYADGRIMTGEEALNYKLIDELGTFEDAIDKARRLAKLDENSPVYDEVKTPVEQILMSLEGMLKWNNIFKEKYPGSGNYRLEYRYLP